MHLNLVASVPDGAPRARRRMAFLMPGKLVAVLALVIVNACATSHAKNGDEHVRELVLHLNNDLGPPSDVTVYAVSSNGVRVLLGDVPPNDHRVLKIPGTISAGTAIHLVADRGLGRPVISQPITVSSNDLIIDWDLQSNSMWFPE